jgi:predicted TIM-barrel fold metal-dependent hydrolase
MAVTHNGVTYRAADAHAHIYPGKIAEKATASVGDFYDIEMQNIGLPHILSERGKAAGIEKFLVCSVATKVEQVRSINVFIEEKCKKYPEFIGLGAWHQDITDIQAEMDDIQSRGLKGIKLHPDFQHFYIDDPAMLPVYEEAAKRGLPVLFHTGDNRTDYSSPIRLMHVVEKIPDFVCIAAHLGGYSQWDDARRDLSGSNVYIDTSSSLFSVTPEQARESIEHFGVDHTLFGTDFPMWRPDTELERFFNLKLSEESNRKILYDNFAKLFHLE